MTLQFWTSLALGTWHLALGTWHLARGLGTRHKRLTGEGFSTLLAFTACLMAPEENIMANDGHHERWKFVAIFSFISTLALISPHPVYFRPMLVLGLWWRSQVEGSGRILGSSRGRKRLLRLKSEVFPLKLLCIFLLREFPEHKYCMSLS